MNNLKYELAVVLLWIIAVVPTLLIVRQTGLFTYLGPLYFLCMVGTVYIVRNARHNRGE